MSQLLSGRLKLAAIPQDLVQYDQQGNAYVWIDVAERQTPGEYGDTHYISIYDKANRQKIYIGDLRPKDLGSGTADASRPSAFPARPAEAPAPAPAAPAAPAPAPAAAPVQQQYPRYQAPNPRTYPRPQASDPNSLDPQPDDLPW